MIQKRSQKCVNASPDGICRTCRRPFRKNRPWQEDCADCKGPKSRMAAFIKKQSQPTFFDGATYNPDLDHDRLKTQFGRVRTLMSDGQWRTLAEIQQKCGGSEAGISARLRDLRKERFGKYRVERNRKGGGLWEYRVTR